MVNRGMMDSNKICFITSVNDIDCYNESLSYWQKLIVPIGMSVDSLVVQGASSMTAAYQEGMEESDAKYKIYLHQDVWIKQLDFLQVMVKAFQQDTSLGIAGVVGSKNLPPSVVWWEGDMIGAVYDDHTGIIRPYLYERSFDECSEAAVLDGLLLMTQYDISWRTDIFDSWHFYDLSQCMEFHRHGYKAGVIPQINPGVYHWCGQNPMDGYDKEREKFIREYGDEVIQHWLKR